MMRTAVMVGEMAATDWAKRAGKPSTFRRRPGPRARAGASLVPAVEVIVSCTPSVAVAGGCGWGLWLGRNGRDGGRGGRGYPDEVASREGQLGGAEDRPRRQSGKDWS